VTRRLLTGATVWAGPACAPRPGWLLIEDEVVAAIGEQGQAPPDGPALALSGHHILPGFVDVHLHLSQAAWFYRGGDALGWRHLADALRAVQVAAETEPEAPWLLFWCAARFAWPEGRLPTAAELDQAAPGRRVLISTLDMHRGAVSSPGLAALGVFGGQRASDFGDDVTRDRRGRPTGEVWEAAYGMVLQRALADTQAHAADQGAGAVLAGEAARCLAHGITHAHDPYVSPAHHERMAALRAATPMRLSWATGSPAGMLSRPPGAADAPAGPYGDAGPEVKLFADGGERCAIRLPPSVVFDLLAGAAGEAWRMRAIGPLREALRRRLVLRPRQLRLPYLRYSDAELTALVADYAEAGIRLRIHALGNLAGQQAAQALRAVGVPASGATIDHLFLLDPATADLVAASGAAVSYQPGFLPGYGDMIVGTRMDRRLAVAGGRLLLRAGVRLALSSDYPCGPLDPLHNLRAAVNRHLPGGRALQPSQALTPSEAVRAHSVTAAASLGAPGSGGLAAGQPADLVICDGDPFRPGTRAVQTWVAGRPVWPDPTTPSQAA
jgi:predicted amidohydrolase YtcJ